MSKQKSSNQQDPLPAKTTTNDEDWDAYLEILHEEKKKKKRKHYFDENDYLVGVNEK